MSTQAPPQYACPDAAQLHVLFEQVLPPVHALPHAWQLELSEVRSTQPEVH